MGTSRDKRNEAHALERVNEDDRVTLVRCPACAGKGMVTPEVAEAIDRMMSESRDRS